MISVEPIGIIHSPHKHREGAPIQPHGNSRFEGRIQVFPDYVQGLSDLDGFERIIVIYHFHLSSGFDLMVKPFLDDTLRGVFATRAPKRPNQIGISILRLDRVEGDTLHVGEIDIVDQTPLIDIKPYVPRFDAYPGARAGWLDTSGRSQETVRADNRFVD
ncbi:MAG: tRNA (N6-threonylcarbamoyladenosine(37)-N6)-methyltransferase TrmO [Pseudomonadota bacterium]